MMTLFSAPAPVLSIAFPQIDPILVEYGPFAIRWYSLSYVVGILLGWAYIGWLNKKEPFVLDKKSFDDLPVWIVIGILLGGRFGYVVFYNFGFYLHNPADIIAVWRGGMSFHGGLIGVIVAIWLFSRRYKRSFLQIADLCVCAAPIGLFLGRIANFINGELYGRITNVAWGMVFPGDPYVRHPSQLYEAALEGFVLFFILLGLVLFTNMRKRPGRLAGVFLMFYALFRAGVEVVREPDQQIGLYFDILSMGQLLCIPMFMIGVVLLVKAPLEVKVKNVRRKAQKST